jgi:hypothetical protein
MPTLWPIGVTCCLVRVSMVNPNKRPRRAGSRIALDDTPCSDSSKGNHAVTNKLEMNGMPCARDSFKMWDASKMWEQRASRKVRPQVECASLDLTVCLLWARASGRLWIRSLNYDLPENLLWRLKFCCQQRTGTPVKMSQLRHFNVLEKLSANQKELQDLHLAWTTFEHPFTNNIWNGGLKLSRNCLKSLTNV